MIISSRMEEINENMDVECVVRKRTIHRSKNDENYHERMFHYLDGSAEKNISLASSTTAVAESS